MNRKTKMLSFVLLLGLLFTLPAFAAGEGGTAEGAKKDTTNWYIVLPAFAMTIASSICALAQSKAIVAACESVSRNPGAADSIRFFLLLGLVLIESLSLYTLLIIFVKT